MNLSKALALVFTCTLLSSSPNLPPNVREQVWHHRNLGKAYYENPMTQIKAVEEFKQALELAPDSTRDRVNYGLALLRAGKTKDAIQELAKAQKEDPTIPHTWFNLGMAYKKEFDHQHAVEQFEGMSKLSPNEPVTHYNLGIEYKLAGKAGPALAQFEAATQLNPNFAAPHFQLFNAYRELGRKEDAARELELFNEVKKRKAGAAVPEDPEWSFYAEIYDVVEMDNEFDHAASAPSFKFQSKKVASGIDPQSAGLLVIDFDGDSRPDLLVWSKNGITLLKNGTTAVPNAGLEGVHDVVSVAAGDFNNDGLADLAVITRSGVSMYVNHHGKFENIAAKMPEGAFTKAVWIDYDHDYDLDLLLLGDKPMLLRNDGAAGFSDQTSRFPFVAGRSVDAATFELVPDNTETDVAVQYDDGRLVIYHDKLLGHYEAQTLPGRWVAGSSLQAFDINNDGWTDLVLATPSGVHLLINDHGKLVEGSGPPREHGPMVLADLANRSLADLIVSNSAYRNLGQGKFEHAAAEGLPAAVAVVAADFDGDGRTDIASVTKDGDVQLLGNQTFTKNNFLHVQLEGVKNLKQAHGAVVEVKTGAWYQKRTYIGVPLVFGLRDYAEVDTVRITWPNGMVQNEVRQPAGKEMSYKEKPRLSGSCPMIFAWNGSEFKFITDVLGVAPLGASNGDGAFFPVNHREYIQIPGTSFQRRGTQYEVRITEELREVSYLDKVQLIAVDHRAGEQIFTNDKFKAPPFPEFRLFGVEQKIHPVQARDQRGENVLPRLLRNDGQYVDTFTHNYAGVAELHHLDLDFGDAAANNRAVLVLSGWVDWADGSTFMSTAQENKDGLIFPYLQVRDSQGHWKTVIADMGIPSGKPKNMAVDLTGKFLSSSREIRIITNMCVYWDEIYLSEKTTAPELKLTWLNAGNADLRYRGFSHAVVHPARTQPEEFDYEKWSPTTMWNPTPGLYTRYGDVRELLTEADDRMVIMGSGDELRLLFDARQLPPVAPGEQRDFLLLVDGWAKDADANTAFARTVEPLPFHGMSSYPYPTSQHFPADTAHREYQLRFNTRPAVVDLGELR
ncbi:MAG TPA: FG-GAP-like repeat-containing protein [Candidatus Solibacter sp.]|nr:FG-GAP-like repeat-containing protein [Candidatus Solibacter sp.]